MIKVVGDHDIWPISLTRGSAPAPTAPLADVAWPRPGLPNTGDRPTPVVVAGRGAGGRTGGGLFLVSGDKSCCPVQLVVDASGYGGR